ncbi:sterol 3-beta-glucosyltransferase UGT80A2 [Prunus yedoensis var. nudiflora]|uniref:Sterol 3-beta-glucosyltransferase UGT80A2 n=1 Tax=Prunus yedoensis var. nudiflora TaxID=2094558 RepID=A0A314UYY2_PRUYE|nr:sterol 3-beta-glucosyltransferase UGT80A2 [Prunus yedoensis var. nudiflora]
MFCHSIKFKYALCIYVLPFPSRPTSEFPHPLSRVKQSTGYKLSYQIVDSLIWLGIGDMINDVRKKKLKLRPVKYLSGSQGSDSDVPILFLNQKVHHGGAGTTAAGLKAVRLTTIVPFYGDQPFWGERVHARGMGPAPVAVKEHVVELAKDMENEDGVTGAIKAFLKHLPCSKPNPEPEPEPSSLFSKPRMHFVC